MWFDYSLFLSGTLISLIIALLLDAIFGDPNWLWRALPHPVAIIGKFINFLDRFFNHTTLGRLNLLTGLVSILLLILCSLALGYGMRLLAEQNLGWSILQIVLVAILLAQQSLYMHVRQIADVLKTGSLAEAREAISHIVGRNPDQLSEEEIARAAIETCAENLSDGVVAPAFWFAIAGFPGILTYKVINTADSMIGYRNDKYRHFGWAAAKLDDFVNYVPSRITGLLICLCAYFVGGSIKSSLKGMAKEASLHKSPNAGWPETAMAFAINVRLAGPRSYGDVFVEAPYFNQSGSISAGPKDICKALKLMCWALALHWVIYLGLYAALA